MELAEQTGTDTGIGDSELRGGMDKRVVVELIEALDRAHECRERSMVDAVCQPCWDDVEAALGVVRNVYKPQSLTWIPPV